MTTNRFPAELTENPFKDDMTGRVLLGRYRIVRKLAAGGMGVVYLARTEGARGFVKPVVVKLILPNFSSDESFLKMFVREAQILSKLNDPGIVSVIDFEQEKNFYIMVLEYVHGFQLREWLKFREFRRKPLPTDVVIEIILKVLEPLHHAHTVANEEGHLLGVVHQDISPSNILINTDGRVKLVDFGIARVMDSSEEGVTTVGKGGFQGKLSYSAPERFSGNPATVKCDLYSVGVVLHQLLVGKNEFFAKNHANTIAQVLHHRPSSVVSRRKDAPPELDTIVQKVLAKDPDYRYETALEFADALRPLLRVDSREADEKITKLVKEDFTDDMAQFLGVEPLGMREKAWRKPSFAPPPPEDEAENTRRITGKEMEELLDDSPFGGSEDYREGQTHESTISLKPPGYSPGVSIPQWTGDDKEDPSRRITVETLAVDHIPAPRMVSIKGLIAVIVTLILAAGAVIFFLMRKPQGEKIVLVQSQVPDNAVGTSNGLPAPIANPTDPSAGIPKPDSAESSAVPSGTDVEEDSALPAPPDPDRKKRPRSDNLTAEQRQLRELTSAFKRQKGKVKSCFNRHAEAVENISQISFIFSVNADGSVKSVGLQPGSINGTPLGNCVRQVAQSTRFPKQSGAISFTIPVRVKL
ncbi:MAG: serine/threonine protein kinase [Deltaproteobacteria bacterium]|nr:serine/threonine protein kinase [Deltaproteobacteria bacterium]